MQVKAPLPLYLTVKEIWRNRLRFALVIGVIALLTILVLFTAALAEGLGAGNREYLAKLEADLVVYQSDSDLQIAASRIDQATLRALRRVEGVKSVGPIAFSSASIVSGGNGRPLDIALLGVVPGQPGEPPVVTGRGLSRADANEVVLDRNTADRTGLQVGDRFTLRSVQGPDEKFYDLTVVGISDGRQYSLRPTVILPHRTWDKVRAKATVTDEPGEVIFNVAAVQLDNPARQTAMASKIAAEVQKVVGVDKVTAYKKTPGYNEQQSTLTTQQIFSLLIGGLVVGGFFQIQMLQRVGQIGMLKAIGASNLTIALAFLLQIIVVTALGVAVGGIGVLLLAKGLPTAVPVAFRADGVGVTILLLLLIGPLGGAVAVRSLLKIEPLTALRLS